MGEDITFITFWPLIKSTIFYLLQSIFYHKVEQQDNYYKMKCKISDAKFLLLALQMLYITQTTAFLVESTVGNTINTTAIEGTYISLRCAFGNIHTEAATYGSVNPDDNIFRDCAHYSQNDDLSVVAGKCDDKQICSFKVVHGTFNDVFYCPGVELLAVSYTCR